MSDETLADRLLNYSDAIVAGVFLGVSAMGIAMGDPETRCEFVRVPTSIAVGNVVLAIGLTIILVRLRKWELDLRSEKTSSEKSARYGRTLHVSRLLILWLSTFATIALIYVAMHDDACETIVGAVAR